MVARSASMLDRRTPPPLRSRKACAACTGQSWKPMMPRPTGRCRRLEVSRLQASDNKLMSITLSSMRMAVRMVCLSSVFQSTCRRRHGRDEVDRAQVADGGLVGRGVEQYLGAEIGRCTTPTCSCGERMFRRVLEGDPGMAGFKQHGQHLAPEFDGGRLEQLDLSCSAMRSYSS